MSDYRDGEALCPYYGAAKRRKDGRPLISCEDGTRVSFPDKCAFASFMEAFCASPDWKSCCVARMRTDYYERLENKRRRKNR